MPEQDASPPLDADSEGDRSSQPRVSRRALLAGAGAAVGALLIPSPDLAALQNPGPGGPAGIVDESGSLGAPTSELGGRAPLEMPKRTPAGATVGASASPLQDFSGTITPSDLHFERHHAGVPRIDPASYKLLVHGLVARPTIFTLDDLKRLPSVTRPYFIECSGNGQSGYLGNSAALSPQAVDGLFSNSEWTGVPVRVLFEEAGVKPEARWFLAEGGDAALMTRSIPIEKALDDALIAYAQNGEPIRPEQGYPARLLLPGWEGNANVKWLRRLELGLAPFMTREETSKYTDPLADCTARIFSFEIDAKSIITSPSFPMILRGAGWREIRGLAWTRRGTVTSVEVSTDGGASWHSAALDGPIVSKGATRFRYMWQWDGQPAVLMSRVTDETGYVQPTTAQLRAARGAGTQYHFNNIRAWAIDASGRVTFRRDG